SGSGRWRAGRSGQRSGQRRGRAPEQPARGWPAMSLWIKLGVLAAAGLACLAVLAVQIGQLGGAAGALADTYPVVARFDDATGVTEGNEIRLAGVRIGKVGGVSVERGEAVVT